MLGVPSANAAAAPAPRGGVGNVTLAGDPTPFEVELRGQGYGTTASHGLGGSGASGPALGPAEHHGDRVAHDQ
eukprot:535311-Lingulodinium_polyedra.AAC.1